MSQSPVLDTSQLSFNKSHELDWSAECLCSMQIDASFHPAGTLHTCVTAKRVPLRSLSTVSILMDGFPNRRKQWKAEEVPKRLEFCTQLQ